MIKNRTTQLIFLTMAITIGLIGCISSFGLFNYVFRWDFYMHFTNLSNYLCVGILITEFIQTLKKQEDDYIKTYPLLKFIGLVAITITFLVFNIVLAPTREKTYLFSINSVTLHILIPLIYICDWVLFYEKKKVKWTYPIISLSFPGCYILFIYIHAAILNFDTSILNFSKDGPFIYPHFFLNIETQTLPGVIKWIFLFFRYSIWYLK